MYQGHFHLSCNAMQVLLVVANFQGKVWNRQFLCSPPRKEMGLFPAHLCAKGTDL